jgi:hypothetical protein
VVKHGLLVLAACSGGTANKPHVVEDARAATSVVVAPPASYRVEPGAFAKGDAQIRVEWQAAPLEARASSGRTTCNTAKVPAVAPTTTWGIPEVIVMIDADHGRGFAPAEPQRLVIAQCELAPHVLVVAPMTPLILASGSSKPERVGHATLGPARPLDASPVAASATARAHSILLPVVGHEVSLSLDPGAITVIEAAEDLAIVVTPAQPYYAITEANGQVVVRDVPVGTFEVRALLPARGGQAARIARGTVTVVAGGLAEVTLTL